MKIVFDDEEFSYQLLRVLGCALYKGADSEAEAKFPGHARKLYDALRSDKEFTRFTAEDAAEEHCQAGASLLSNQCIFDWLDKTFSEA